MLKDMNVNAEIVNTTGAITESNPLPIKVDGKTSSVSITRPNDTTAYTANDVVGTSPATNLQFDGCSDVAGGSVEIKGVSLEIDVAAVPAGMDVFRLHLYNAAPTAIADNTAFNLPAGDRAKYLGNITITLPVDLGATLWANVDNLSFKRDLAVGSTSLYGILETVGGYTPTAQAVKKVTLHLKNV